VKWRAGRSESGSDARVSDLVARHERSLLRIARHWSLCHDDALDAYQRALEIYVRRIESLDPATEAAWLRVVVKHEAIAVRRQRAESVPVEDVDFDSRAAEAQRPVDDLRAGRERVERSAEALRRLKRDEAKALMLKAQEATARTALLRGGFRSQHSPLFPRWCPLAPIARRRRRVERAAGGAWT
jgi:DNA-directed RNA polymerase specialized sigma24 family protein